MPGLLKKPTAVTIPGAKNAPHYAVSFSYEFEGVPVQPNQNIGGIPYNGSEYTFNSLDVSTSASLPTFRSMQFSISFFNDDTPGEDLDGQLIIYVPASGQIIRIPSSDNTATNAEWNVVSGVVPIIANMPTSIQFAKQANANTAGLLHGLLIVTLFDFEISPYILRGFSATQ